MPHDAILLVAMYDARSTHDGAAKRMGIGAWLDRVCADPPAPKT